MFKLKILIIKYVDVMRIKIRKWKMAQLKTICWFVVCCVGFLACEDYDDADLWKKVNELQERVQKLEDFCKESNANIQSIQTLLDAVEQRVSIVAVNPLENGGGYVMQLSNDKTITIYHGKDGKSSQIGIKNTGDGNYYWTLNDEIIKDAQSNPLPVTGKPGVDGTDGKDAPMPILKTGNQLIQEGIKGDWDKTAVYLSVDAGGVWTKVSGKDGDTIFADVDIKQSDVIVFTLSDGSQITLPRTDKTLALLLGSWYSVETGEVAVVFNSDFTYQKLYDYSEKGIFEYYPKHDVVVLCDTSSFYYSKTFYSIFEVSDERLILGRDGSSDVWVFYRNRPDFLEITELQVPKEGGVYMIGVKSVDGVLLKEINHVGPPITDNGIYTGREPMCISAECTFVNGVIQVKVEPAAATIMYDKEVWVYDNKGYRIGQFTIRQEGLPEGSVKPQLQQYAIDWLKGTAQKTENVFNRFLGMDLKYTNLQPDADFKAPLSSNNNLLFENWMHIYNLRAGIDNFLQRSDNELPDGPLHAPLHVLRSICYYKLAVYWGNVPYHIGFPSFSGTQLSVDKLFAELLPELKAAINSLEEKKNMNQDIFESMFFSKDIARILLAKMYQYQGKYSEAKPLLEQVVAGGFYSLESHNDYSASDNREIILKIGNFPVYTYSDVLLSLAECELNLGGDAASYLNQVAMKKGIHCSTSDMKTALKEVYIQTQESCGDYFAFLKRNGIAMKELGLSNENYLLFPIPEEEGVVQNPGYN